MGRYRKVKTVRLNLLEGSAVQPIGAFVKNGEIIPGWTGMNERVNPVRNLIAMADSYVGIHVLALDSNGNVYAAARNNGTELEIIYSGGSSYGFIFETNGATISGAVVMSGCTYTYSNTEGITHGKLDVFPETGIVKNGRLFVGDHNDMLKFRWSGRGGWKDWDSENSDAGYLDLEPYGGKIQKIFDMEGELILVREACVTRVAVGGNPENFKILESIQIPYQPIVTAERAGNAILFVSECGFMRYSKDKVTKMDGPMTDDLVNPLSSFVFRSRYYFVCGKSRSLDRSVIYVYDVYDDSYQIIDIPAYFVNCDAESVLAYTDTAIFRVRRAYSDWNYGVISDGIDFGTDSRKLATTLELDCDPDVNVTISDGKYMRTIYDAAGKTTLNMRGAEFTVTFSGSTGKVRSAYLTAEVPQ